MTFPLLHLESINAKFLYGAESKLSDNDKYLTLEPTRKILVLDSHRYFGSLMC